MRPSVVLAVVAVACGGEPITEGLEEPLRVRDAQFREGKIPGLLPLTADEINAGATPESPTVTSLEGTARVVSQSELGVSLSGRVSAESYGVAFQFEDEGSGYWLLPASAPAPQFNDELTWSAVIDIGAALEPGLRRLLIAAVGEDGRSGTQQELNPCVRGPIPDNLNACDPRAEPPALVVSLAWSNPADLDLRIVASDGSVIDSENLTGKDGARGGRLERDANAGCREDGEPRENTVWDDPPVPGLYLVYVNLHDACGARAATFTVSTHVSEERGDTFRQVETFRISGNALALQANGGSRLGLFVTEFRVD